MSVGMEWRRERVRLGTGTSPVSLAAEEERLRGFVELAEWVTPALSLRGGVGLERWPARGRVGSVSVGMTWLGMEDDVRLSTSADHWRGGGEPFTRGSVALRLRRSLVGPVDGRISAGATAVSASAPAMVWPGAGTGRVRDPLLRGHPLEEDGAIAGPAFGRRLAYATGELRLSRRLGPLRYGGAVFVDLAKAWERSAQGAVEQVPESPLLVDPGIGLFLDTGDRELRLDLARGESRWVLTAGVRAPS